MVVAEQWICSLRQESFENRSRGCFVGYPEEEDTEARRSQGSLVGGVPRMMDRRGSCLQPE